MMRTTKTLTKKQGLVVVVAVAVAGVLRSYYLIIGIKLSGLGEVDKVNSVSTDVIEPNMGRRSSIIPLRRPYYTACSVYSASVWVCIYIYIYKYVYDTMYKHLHIVREERAYQ